MNVVFPIKSVENEIHGFLVLGAKKSGTKFSVEDVDLLNTVISRCTALMDKIKLQEELITERIKHYRFELIGLNEVVRHTLKLMQYQLKLQKFVVESNLTEDEGAIHADKDAVEEVLINLISN